MLISTLLIESMEVWFDLWLVFCIVSSYFVMLTQDSDVRHSGDLGNIDAGHDGKAEVNLIAEISLIGPTSIIGFSLDLFLHGLIL